jgi:citrate synthase
VLARLKPGRRLDTNVEFYTALVLEALALSRELFTPIFAIGRVVGWTAHVLEQTKGGRIIRPASVYVGPLPQAAA